MRLYLVQSQDSINTQYFPPLQTQETERLLAEPAPGIAANPHEDNLRYFDVVMEGPSSTPFEGMCLLHFLHHPP